MKAAQVFMLVIIAALVAGCSTRSRDVIVGTWQSDSEKEYLLTFYDNGTYVTMFNVNGTISEGYNGTWKALNNSEYTVICPSFDPIELKYVQGKLYNVYNIDYTFSRA